MRVIKDGRAVADDWQHLDDQTPLGPGPCTVSAKRWLAERDALSGRAAAVGVRLSGGDDVAAIAADCASLGLVVVEFPALADGRGFSLARLLRERYGYRGELRACGQFIRDQVFFLSRVGVDAFQCGENDDPADILSALQEFSVKYQACTDQPQPLYRQHRRGG